MVIDLAILLVQDILEMNGGTTAHPDRSEFTYSPKIEIEDGGAIISVRIVDTVTDCWRWAYGEDIIARVHEITQELIDNREIYRQYRVTALRKEIDKLCR